MFCRLTLRNVRTKFWWARDRTGNPFLLVTKMLVGTMSALTGSPVHLSISRSDGRSAVSFRTTPIFLLLSHRVRNLFHLQRSSEHQTGRHNVSKYDKKTNHCFDSKKAINMCGIFKNINIGWNII